MNKGSRRGWRNGNRTCTCPVSPAKLAIEEETTMVAFKKILFPTDFSANADKALTHAIRLANFDNGEVIVQHVVGDYFEKHPHWATLFDLHELQEYMDCYVDAHMKKILANETDIVRFRTVLSKGKPA